MSEDVRVEQCDRDRAAKLGYECGMFTAGEAEDVIRGDNDECDPVKAFACSRIDGFEDGFRAGMIKAREGLEQTFAACGVDWEPRHD